MRVLKEASFEREILIRTAAIQKRWINYFLKIQVQAIRGNIQMKVFFLIMVDDPRYIAAKRMVEQGDINTFNQLFSIIPKSIVAADLGTQNVRFTTLMNHIERFTLQELFMLSKLFSLDEKAILELAYNQYTEQKRSKSGKTQ